MEYLASPDRLSFCEASSSFELFCLVMIVPEDVLEVISVSEAIIEACIDDIWSHSSIGFEESLFKLKLINDSVIGPVWIRDSEKLIAENDSCIKSLASFNWLDSWERSLDSVYWNSVGLSIEIIDEPGMLSTEKTLFSSSNILITLISTFYTYQFLVVRTFKI